jgi:hypothetical protein
VISERDPSQKYWTSAVTMNQQAVLDDDQAVLGCLINIVSFSLDS